MTSQELRPGTRAAWAALSLAVMLVLGAMADPSGLFAPIGWTGHAIGAFWWWAPYAVCFPPAVALAFFTGLKLSCRSRWRRFLGLWAIMPAAMAVAAILRDLAILAWMTAQGHFVLPLGSSVAFIVWSGGYPALKIAMVAWLPALAVAWPSSPRAGHQAVPVWSIGAALLLTAVLSPWISAHWWRGSPLGYTYDAVPGFLLAPVPDAGLFGMALSLAVLGGAMWVMRGGWAGALVAVAGLLAAQWGTLAFASTGRGDWWLLAAGVVYALNAFSFAPIFALLSLCGRNPRLFAAALAASAVLAFLPPPARAPRSQGAQVVLRGVNVNQLGDYFERDPHLPGTVPLTEQDFADIAGMGMNAVRLTLSWSRLEPAPGQISQSYIARIRSALGWAQAHGIHVILDMHQDGWGAHVAAPAGYACRAGSSPMTGWDGAPRWATLTDGTAPCQVTGRDMAPNVSRAFQSFYMDREDIQTHLVEAWKHLAASFAGDPAVAGFDLLNEPNFAESPPLASTLLLANYYARAIAAIRQGEAGGSAHPIFVEPSIFWSGFGFDNLPPPDFSNDPQLVFSPHLYNESITSDQDLGFNLVSIERGYALAEAAAKQLGMPLWIGEWGYFGDPAAQAPLMRRQLAAEAAAHIGSAFWVWKQGCGDPHVYPGAIAGNLRRLHCPDQTELGLQTTISGALSR